MKTYEEKDETRTPIEWTALNSIMLGTISEAGIVRRMDGSRCTPKDPRPADAKRLETFSLTGQWEFPLITDADIQDTMPPGMYSSD